MLEEVFQVAPVPEDYMKYQLHLSTGMEVPQIEQWFQNRRSTDGSSQRPLEGRHFAGTYDCSMLPHRSLRSPEIEQQYYHTDCFRLFYRDS